MGSVREAEQAARAGAAGIGLVRTELLFLGRTTPPGEREQASLYRRIAATMEGRPVVFRTLDIGGDKPADYQAAEAEANPALGVRGLRLGLRHPELLGTQLAALVDATAGGTLRVLFPMVAVPEELEAARDVLDRVVDRARGRGSAPVAVLVGIMVEVPSAAIVVRSPPLSTSSASARTISSSTRLPPTGSAPRSPTWHHRTSRRSCG